MKIFVVASACIFNDYFAAPAINGIFKDKQEALNYAKEASKREIPEPEKSVRTGDRYWNFGDYCVEEFEV